MGNEVAYDSIPSSWEASPVMIKTLPGQLIMIGSKEMMDGMKETLRTTNHIDLIFLPKGELVIRVPNEQDRITTFPGTISKLKILIRLEQELGSIYIHILGQWRKLRERVDFVCEPNSGILKITIS